MSSDNSSLPASSISPENGIKRFLVIWNNRETTIISGVNEDDAHANARFNVHAWEDMHCCYEIREGEQVKETLPLSEIENPTLRMENENNQEKKTEQDERPLPVFVSPELLKSIELHLYHLRQIRVRKTYLVEDGENTNYTYILTIPSGVCSEGVAKAVQDLGTLFERLLREFGAQNEIAKVAEQHRLSMIETIGNLEEKLRIAEGGAMEVRPKDMISDQGDLP